jgi:hypothetical protein
MYPEYIVLKHTGGISVEHDKTNHDDDVRV